MSDVKMCDFCGRTSRSADEVKRLRLPRDFAPECFQAVNTGTDINLDACPSCRDALVEAIEGVITGSMSRHLAEVAQ